MKLQVFLAEYCLFYRALLQKRPIILSILLTESTPSLYQDWTVWKYRNGALSNTYTHTPGDVTSKCEGVFSLKSPCKLI